MGSFGAALTRLIRAGWIVRGGIIATALALGLIVGITVYFQVAYANRILPGVRALGVDIGGRDPNEARALLQVTFDRYAQTNLPLGYATNVWHLSPAALGLTFDAERTVAASYSYGRDGSIFNQIIAQISLLGGGYEVAPSLTVDDARITEALTKINEEVRQQPTNAALEIRDDGTVAIKSAQTGQEIDLDAASARIQRALLKLSPEPITLPDRLLSVSIPEEAVIPARERAQELIGEPLTLRFNDQTMVIEREQLAGLIEVTHDASSVQVEWNDARLRAVLESYGQEINRPVVDAGLALAEDATVQVTAPQEGLRLDIDATLAAIRSQANATQRTIDVVVEHTPPKVTLEDIEPARAQLEELVAGPLKLEGNDQVFLLDPTDLAAITKITIEAEPQPRAMVELDRAELTGFVERAGKKLMRPARNARFRYAGGALQVVQEEQAGQQVDVERTVEALLAALKEPDRTAEAVFVPLPPKVTTDVIDQVVVSDRIMDASSSYAGSIPERAHNVELAAERLNGTVVAPGDTFSFNEALGPATLRNGFKLGYGIALNSNGDAETIPSEAGGICQVATTLFQAVFWAGYPIEERNWHLYWIPKYGQPPRGLKGLDATVDDQYGVDFKFRNNTDDWLVITSSTDGSNLSFALYGVKPDWEVRVGDPVITNVVKADPTIVRQLDTSLAPGRELWVESAADGFSASIQRTVVRGGEIVDQWTARSSYVPARNVILVGPSPAPAAPTAAEEPSAPAEAQSEAPATDATAEPTP